MRGARFYNTRHVVVLMSMKKAYNRYSVQEIFTIHGAARHQKFSSSSKGSLVLVRSRPCWPIAVLVVT